MKIIHYGDIRIIMKNREEYKIKTPLGIFTDINDAITQYPILEEHKRIIKCGLCGKYFIKYGREDNSRKYCSRECYKKAHSIINQKNYYKRIFTGQGIFKADQYTQKLEDHTNRDFNKDKTKLFIQDDNYWGLGESHLAEHKANNFYKEHEYIRKEKKRLLER